MPDTPTPPRPSPEALAAAEAVYELLGKRFPSDERRKEVAAIIERKTRVGELRDLLAVAVLHLEYAELVFTHQGFAGCLNRVREDLAKFRAALSAPAADCYCGALDCPACAERRHRDVEAMRAAPAAGEGEK